MGLLPSLPGPVRRFSCLGLTTPQAGAAFLPDSAQKANDVAARGKGTKRQVSALPPSGCRSQPTLPRHRAHAPPCPAEPLPAAASCQLTPTRLLLTPAHISPRRGRGSPRARSVPTALPPGPWGSCRGEQFMPLPNEDQVPGHLTTPPRRVRAAREALPVTHPTHPGLRGGPPYPGTTSSQLHRPSRSPPTSR